MKGKPSTRNKLPHFSTGLPSLDSTLNGLLPGDNVVWQVDEINEYRPFVDRFIDYSRTLDTPIVYFRFASHRPLIPENSGVEIHPVEPGMGFEPFVGEILDVIEQKGRGALYVFDSLSELAADWYSDRMLGNFFMITCPFLFQLDTITYFALLSNHHSFHAIDSIHQTAQVVINVHRNRERVFIHPLKVEKRSSPTLYMLHEWERDDSFIPVSASTTIAEIMARAPQPWLDFAATRPGIWMQTVLRARKSMESSFGGSGSLKETQESFQRLLRGAITRDARFLPLTRRYFDLPDLLAIIQRMIGTGLIGGKALGMLLARAIIRKHSPELHARMEPHDSFYIGSDVFYTYLVQNGCWELRRKATDLNFLMEQNEATQRKLMSGSFPDYIRRQFSEMLDYFGQAPIIVRSSSLLEDSYGNAFSGKYETVFCANQGNPAQRLESFMQAVRTVYASTLSPEALSYRHQRGLLDRDEQMSLLVQRVSGDRHGTNYFPQVAGVGFSFNPFVWNEDIDPKAGMIRLVFGLGTRAVDRTGDDYTRLIALNAPEKRPEGAPGDSIRYSQHNVDVLDLSENQLKEKSIAEVLHDLPGRFPQDLFFDRHGTPIASGHEFWHTTFNRMIRETPFVADMRAVLEIVQDAYEHPVDIEFTANFSSASDYRINLVQCRPFQVRITGSSDRLRSPSTLRRQDILLESGGPIIGQSASTPVDRLVLVVPAVYGRMTVNERYAVARAIGKLNRLAASGPAMTLMLVGPGRWATTTPALGIPVSFAEINAASIVCEIAAMHEGLIPDVSLGTHFFNDLVEMNMLYLAVAPDRKGHNVNSSLITSLPNKLTTLLPQSSGLEQVLWVVDSVDIAGGARLYLHADSFKQKAVVYLSR